MTVYLGCRALELERSNPSVSESDEITARVVVIHKFA